MYQNALTARNATKTASFDVAKKTSNTHKTLVADKQINPNIPSKLNYNFQEDMKRTKENISLF